MQAKAQRWGSVGVGWVETGMHWADRAPEMGWIIKKLWLFKNRGKPHPVWAELSACHAWSPLPWQAAWTIGQSPGLEVRGGLDSGPGSATTLCHLSWPQFPPPIR